MIGYLILDKFSFDNDTKYLGIYRSGALMSNPIAEGTDEFNLWFEHVDFLHDNDFFLYDIHLAQSFLSKYNSLGKNYEILGCLDVSEKDFTEESKDLLIYNENFMGYDITNRNNYSLIFWNGYYKSQILSEEQGMRVLSYEYFAPKLNKFGLFDKYKDAKFFAYIELLLAKIHPHLDWLHLEESKETKLKIYKLYKVS